MEESGWREYQSQEIIRSKGENEHVPVKLLDGDDWGSSASYWPKQKENMNSFKNYNSMKKKKKKKNPENTLSETIGQNCAVVYHLN